MKICNILTKTRFLKNIFKLIHIYIFWKFFVDRKIYIKIENYSWKSIENLLFQLIEHAKIVLNSSLSYKLYFIYNENLIIKKKKWTIKFRKLSYKSNAIIKLYAILFRKLWKKSSHKFNNLINKKKHKNV